MSLHWRLAAAMVRDGDVSDAACDLDRFIDGLSERDRAVLSKVVQRISEIEATEGEQAAETAARQVLDILEGARGDT